MAKGKRIQKSMEYNLAGVQSIGTRIIFETVSCAWLLVISSQTVVKNIEFREECIDSLSIIYSEDKLSNIIDTFYLEMCPYKIQTMFKFYARRVR